MYTLQQQVFTLSWLSNDAAGSIGTAQGLEAAVVTRIDRALTDPRVTAYIGNWQIAWGPVIFENSGTAGPSDVADNTAAVFKGTDGGNPVYVVAIAGTNFISAYGWLDEDAVGPTPVPFSGAAWIAAGTHRGLEVLEGLVDPQHGPLQPFLESLASSDATLVFTGHSLGGALSPTLALDLVVNRNFDRSRWANVYVYPSAGPTPGNQAFSDLFAATFPAVSTPGGAPWQVWNQDVVNKMDVVPRAWNDLRSLPSLYAPNVVSPVIASIVGFLTLKEDLLVNRYAPLPASPIAGSWYPLASSSDSPFFMYLEEAMYQHIGFYLETIIPEIAPFLREDRKGAQS